MVKKNNPWVSIADLFSSVTLVVLLLFVMGLVAPRMFVEQQRKEIMNQYTSDLADFESKGQIRIYADKSLVEFTSVTFQQGSALLSNDAKKLAQALAAKLKQSMDENPRLEMLIEGHTDPAVVRATTYRGGYFENNIQLSSLRAINVREELLKTMGQEYSSRIGVAGYGETRLKNTEDVFSPDNRRVEVRFFWEGRNSETK